MTNPVYPRRLLTYKQIADRLSISLGTARKLFDEGELVRIKVGTRAVRASEEDVEAFIKRRSADPRA